MPTREFRRAWCKKCNEWELFSKQPPNNEDWFCTVCEEAYEPIFLSHIPKEKILEQRERYKKSQGEEFSKLFGTYMNPTMSLLQDMFREPGYDDHIIEADAGQRAIDQRERDLREEKRLERARIKEADHEEYKNYVDLGRNDSCACGSGKKYKKCECFNRIQEIRTKYNDFR